jgi:endoglucanase
MKFNHCFMHLAAMLCISLLYSCSNGERDDASLPLGGFSSSSSLPSGMVWCLYSGGCTAIAPESCSAIGGQILENCPAASSSGSSSFQSGGSSSSQLGGSSSSQLSGSSSSQLGGSSSSQSGGAITPGTSGPVSYYGKLQASGNKIVGSKTGSTAVQVRGVSLGWSNTGWESASFFTAATVNAMVDDWKAEIIRVPMGYAASNAGEYNGSYLADKPGNMNRVKAAIDAAIAKGVYVIIDWHTHTSNPTDASAYFTEMASTYGNYPNVIFEIFNEPLSVSWSSIRSYATTVINTIRNYSDNLILVGTPNYDQDVHDIVTNPLTDANVAYVAHFYAASHPLNSDPKNSGGPTFANRINNVRTAGYPVFVSEYGTVAADGNGAHNASNSNTWMTFLNSNNISYCAWHVNNKNEASAFFKSTFTPSASAAWTSTSNMTASGQYIYNNLVSWNSNAPWRGGTVIGNSSSSGTTYGTLCEGYCYWAESGCVEIRTDPDAVYGLTPITTCSAARSNCSNYGNGPYNNDPTCGGASSTSYCLDYFDSSCVLMSKLLNSSCASWAYGDYEISSSCPSGWTYY